MTDTTTLLAALRDAAMSLEAIANSAGDDLLLEVAQIRAYARNRAIVARAALAQHDAVREQPDEAGVREEFEYWVRVLAPSWVRAMATSEHVLNGLYESWKARSLPVAPPDPSPDAEVCT